MLIASDGPRLSVERPTVFLGSRGSISFDIWIDARKGGHHSGNWGGLLSDPAIQLAHAIASITEPTGKIRIRSGFRQAFPRMCDTFLLTVRWKAARTSPRSIPIGASLA